MNDFSVGIDVGTESFDHLSDGTVIENPRFLKKEEKAIAKAQKKLAQYEKGSPERKKYKKVVAKSMSESATNGLIFAIRSVEHS